MGRVGNAVQYFLTDELRTFFNLTLSVKKRRGIKVWKLERYLLESPYQVDPCFNIICFSFYMCWCRENGSSSWWPGSVSVHQRVDLWHAVVFFIRRWSIDNSVDNPLHSVEVMDHLALHFFWTSRRSVPYFFEEFFETFLLLPCGYFYLSAFHSSNECEDLFG